jgi:hypothetical protein
MKMRKPLLVFSLIILAIIPLRGQLQSDSSDALWSIVMPIAQSQDIDMRECLVGNAKDSLIIGFVGNAGTWKFRVDSIYFVGADAGAFSIVSGFPKYELLASENKNTELRFKPVREGSHQAEIVIITQADTLKQTIVGEGIKPQLEVITDILDFGLVEIGNDKTIQDTALLKNISGKTVSITDVVLMGPDTSQFEIISGAGAFTLLPNQERRLSIIFKPESGGRTSGRIGFEFSDVGSPAVAYLFGQGIGGKVFIADDSAYAGESRSLKLVMGNIKPDRIASIAPNFEATIRFQKTILAPVGTSDWSISMDSVYVKVKGLIGTSAELASIPVIAGLGNTEVTSLDIMEMNLFDDKGNKIEYSFETESGLFKLLGICDEGGKRLINPNNQQELMKLSPNPVDDEINVELNLIEEGKTEIAIYNGIGNEVYKRSVEYMDKELMIDTSNFGNGFYFVKLVTPGITKVEPIMILR